jgi:hypothetical protein
MKAYSWLVRHLWLIRLITILLIIPLVYIGDWVGLLLLAAQLVELWWWIHTHAFKVEVSFCVDNDDGTETKKTYGLKHQWED